MTTPTCPICAGAMRERTVAPCFDCGHDDSELRELAAGEHEYHRYRVFGQAIVLCDFCDADFGSYYPDYFGLPAGPVGEANYEFDRVSKVEDPQPVTDFVCESCKRRLAFLTFLAAARRANA